MFVFSEVVCKTCIVRSNPLTSTIVMLLRNYIGDGDAVLQEEVLGHSCLAPLNTKNHNC